MVPQVAAERDGADLTLCSADGTLAGVAGFTVKLAAQHRWLKYCATHSDSPEPLIGNQPTLGPYSPRWENAIVIIF